MNRQNFDTTSESPYPLTVDRMAEMQDDWQAALRLLAMLSPLGECIVAGCETAGSAGFVCLAVDGGHELFEVKAGVAGTYLNLHEDEVKAKDPADESRDLVVRTESYLEWGYTKADDCRTWADLPRLWVRKGAQDDAGWVGCTNGTNWTAGTSGVSVRVQHVGGRVHLWGSVTYAPYIRVSDALYGTDYIKALGNDLKVGDLVRATTSKTDFGATVAAQVASARISAFTTNQLTLPSGYRPQGDLLIPVRYNGTPAMAVIDAGGQLLLSSEAEIGDTLEIDTYFEI